MNKANYYKRILVHDLEQEDFQKQFSHLDEDILVLSKEKHINHCIGCFGCWIKTPGTCVMKDSYQDHGKNLCYAEEFILISKCTYGGFSPFIKNVIDKSPTSLLPFFTIRNGEVHHTARIEHPICIKAYFYGDDITDEEKETATKLVKANEINLVASKSEAHFYASSSDIAKEGI